VLSKLCIFIAFITHLVDSDLHREEVAHDVI
jgi:hypothetical protein